MLNASRLSIIEEAGVAVLTLTEGLEKDEFLASRLTRAETRRQIKTLSESIANLSPQTLSILAEVDWGGVGTPSHGNSVPTRMRNRTRCGSPCVPWYRPR